MTGSKILALAIAVVTLIGIGPANALAGDKRDDKRDDTRETRDKQHHGAREVPTVVLEVVGLAHSGREIHRQEFSVDTLRDLRIVAWWNVAGAHVQRLELRAPDGSLYQRLSRSFDTAESAGRHRGRHRGTPVETLLPVGGTWITDFSLVGHWQIEIYLDDSRTPIASASFLLNP